MEFHHNHKVTQVLNTETPTATAAGNKTSMVDRAGFKGLTLHIGYGLWTTTGADWTVRVEESDDTTSGNFTSVADADLLNTEALAGVAGAAAVTTKVTKKISYIGAKRYVRAVINTDTATGSLVVNAVQTNPIKAPQA